MSVEPEVGRCCENDVARDTPVMPRLQHGSSDQTRARQYVQDRWHTWVASVGVILPWFVVGICHELCYDAAIVGGMMSPHGSALSWRFCNSRGSRPPKLTTTSPYGTVLGYWHPSAQDSLILLLGDWCCGSHLSPSGWMWNSHQSPTQGSDHFSLRHRLVIRSRSRTASG